jgi:hypothetical protein
VTTQLQLRRDTTANIGAITPAQGEPIYDVTRKALVLGDGATAGGNAATPFAGSWTPQLELGGGSTGMTYAQQVGTWVQVGPIVIATFFIALSAKGSATGAVTIGGLPAVPLAGIYGAVTHAYHANMNTADNYAHYVNAAGAIALGKSGSASWAALADTDFTNTSTIAGVAIFEAAQPTA